MASGTFYCTSNSGNVKSENATYLTARSGGTLSLEATWSVGGQRISAGTYRCYNGFMEFDLSTIPAGAAIESVALRFTDFNNGGGATTSFAMRARLRDFGVAVATGDYVAGASLQALPLLGHYAVTSGIGSSPVTLVNDQGMLDAVAAAAGSTLRMIMSSGRLEAATVPPNFEYCEHNTTGGTSTTNAQMDVVWTVVTATRPDADTTTTGWTTTPLWSKIEESAADATIVTATTA